MQSTKLRDYSESEIKENTPNEQIGVTNNTGFVAAGVIGALSLNPMAVID